MAGPGLVPQVLVASKKTGTQIASFTTFTRVINDEDVVPISAPWMNTGMYLHIDALFGISNIITSTPTFQFQVKLGGQVVWTSDALTTKSTASSLLPCELDIKLRLDSIGKTSAAKVIGNGRFFCAAFNPTSGLLQAATPAVGTGFGSTADDGSANLDFGLVCSASNASNAAICYRYIVTMPQY